MQSTFLLGLLEEEKHHFDKTMPCKVTIPLITQPTPLQQHQGSNSNFVTDDANVLQLEKKMIIAL